MRARWHAARGHGRHLVAALAATDVLLEVPPGIAELPTGTLVGTVRWFGRLEEGQS